MYLYRSISKILYFHYKRNLEFSIKPFYKTKFTVRNFKGNLRSKIQHFFLKKYYFCSYCSYYSYYSYA